MRARFSSWWRYIRKHWVATIIVVFVCVILLIVLGYLFKWDWTGFNEHVGPNVQQYQATKTLWDWLQLLGVLAIPAVVGLGAAWYTVQQGKVSDRENTDNQREIALQAYIDKMSELLLEKHLRTSQPEDEVRTIARVRTITVLTQLDARRIGYVFAFLQEAGLMSISSYLAGIISTPSTSSVVSLDFADLHAVKWEQAYLVGAILSNADLSGARLREADLSGANLKDAKHILIGELEKQAASLKGATMPDGSKHS